MEEEQVLLDKTETELKVDLKMISLIALMSPFLVIEMRCPLYQSSQNL